MYMNTAVINVKVNPKVKSQAQKTAHDLGISLSSVINRALRSFIKTRSVTFSDDIRLEPTSYLKRMIKQSESDIKARRVSPSFSSAKESIAWLDDPNARYQNGDSVR